MKAGTFSRGQHCVGDIMIGHGFLCLEDSDNPPVSVYSVERKNDPVCRTFFKRKAISVICVPKRKTLTVCPAGHFTSYSSG